MIAGSPMLRIIFHAQCFDGLASAALFSRFYQEVVAPGAPVEFAGTTYTKRQGVDPELFLLGPGEENAIVDFKYSSHDRVGWWFDHHQAGSSFPTPADREHFERQLASPIKHYDPASKSCARLIWRVLGDQHGFAPPELEEMVDWADRIDSGAFSSAGEVVELRSAALRLGLVIQHTYSDEFAARLIGDLGRKSVAEVVELEYIADRLPGLVEVHREIVEDVREHADVQGDVLFYDVAHRPHERIDRFIPYYLDEDIRYSVGISRNASGVKIAVGFNPWSPSVQAHSIARVCEKYGGQYGGGGHHNVGGISLGPADYDLAVSLARTVTETLNAAPCTQTTLPSNGSLAPVPA